MKTLITRSVGSFPQRSLRCGAILVGIASAMLLSACGGNGSASGGGADTPSLPPASGPTTTPATGPSDQPSTSLPSSYPGVTTTPTASSVDQKYLQNLKSQDIALPDDQALTVGSYVCNSQREKIDPKKVKIYVTAMVGSASGAKTDTEAKATADKVIAAAKSNLCAAGS